MSCFKKSSSGYFHTINALDLKSEEEGTTRCRQDVVTMVSRSTGFQYINQPLLKTKADWPC